MLKNKGLIKIKRNICSHKFNCYWLGPFLCFEREGGAVHYNVPPLAPEWETEIADGVACFWVLVWVRAFNQFTPLLPLSSETRL
jgi:hypothetical protein